ncbi:Cyclic nucleotide-gated cation channel beta-1, partial [Brachionus plicatilis]
MSSLEQFFRSDKKILWLVADYICDLTRIKFIRDGMWVQDIKSTSKKYFNSIKFIFDIASVIPIDILQILVGIFPLLRLNRWLKVNSLWEFFDRWDRSVQSYAFLVRLIRLFVYLQIVVHLYACTYFKISLWETRNYQINNEWVYNFKDSHINNYVYSYLFGLKTASTIGNNPQP